MIDFNVVVIVVYLNVVKIFKLVQLIYNKKKFKYFDDKSENF
jgi:hypothetical protein